MEMLRVMSGLHRGAKVPLQRPGLIVLGSSDDCDVVLMDSGVAPRHAAITVHEQEVIVRALECRVDHDAKPVAAGETMALLALKPLIIGGATLMIGDEQALEEKAALEESAPEAVAAHPDVDDQTDGTEAAQAQLSPSALRNRLIARVMVGVAAVTLFTIAAVGVSQNIAAKKKTPEQRVTQILEDLKLSKDVRLSTTEEGVLLLKGTTRDAASHSKLVQRLNEEGLAPALRLSIGEHLASAVKDVFRVNGLQVNTQYTQAGVVLVSGLRGSAKQYTKVIDHAMKDVSGLTSVRIVPGKPLKGSLVLAGTGSSNIDASAKRVVSVVDSRPAYIVTADGSRYFVGSLLPQGHRVLAINGTSVTLERDGEQLVMTF